MTEPHINKVGISEENLAELVFDQVTDGEVWYRLSLISKKFNKVGKKKLIEHETYVGYWYKKRWTTLPNGVLHGLCESWYSNEQINAKKYFVNNKLHGPYKLWDENGQIVVEHHYLNGILHGPYKTWTVDGQISCETNYLNNEIHGLCKSWHRNAYLVDTSRNWVDRRGMNLCKGLPCDEYSWCENNYLHGIKNGLCRGWYSNGQLMYYCNYHNGQKHGKYKWWDQNGNCVIDKNYVYVY